MLKILLGVLAGAYGAHLWMKTGQKPTPFPGPDTPAWYAQKM